MTNQTKNTIKNTNSKGVNTLQNELLQYLKDHDTMHLEKVAKTIVSKTMINYAKTSDDGYYLYKCNKNPNTQNQDIKDLRQQAILSMITDIMQEQIFDTNYIIKNAFHNVNSYLYNQRTIKLSCRPYDFSIEQLEQNGLYLVNVRKGVTTFFKDNEYNDIDELETTNELRKKQQKLIYRILQELTPLQKQIAKLLALGYSERQIGNKLNRSNITIHGHIQAIRNKANKIKFDN